MAFLLISNNVVAFAEYEDVQAADQRLFETNEGLTETIIEDALIKATGRILSRLRSSVWWQRYYISRSPTAVINTVADVPALDPNRIKGRKQDFTDLCIAVGMSDYILPRVADFGTTDNAEQRKMAYYAARGEKLFGELIVAGDWYDFDDSGTIASNEKQPWVYNLKRSR
jgi:hypothetical protein